ncbi:Rieske (2Fe-2S) protein [Fodinicola acaciae]|uniref:Rieske (2Fe-2S) protein n=1 Tax=Fodinicola acaciae TaxID=2681555 RepID=UPI0013D836BC|nr:Rieske 2Fe-2S domain-containing protein [Fodinicola acaciae]
MRTRQLRRFVADLLRGRRTRRFAADADEEAYVRTAIELRSAAGDRPSEEFVDALRKRLSAAMEDESAEPVRLTTGRRRFVQAAGMVAGVAAGSAAVGAAAGFTLGQQETLADQGDTLQPNDGQWRTVAASAELPDGGVKPFDLGTVLGFVQRTDGKLRAVSGVCTHLGCRLVLDLPHRQLNCPCHRAAFSVGGQVLRHQLPTQLPPLPRLAVREIDGAIQVFAPHA